jgi:hypothetical protein
MHTSIEFVFDTDEPHHVSRTMPATLEGFVAPTPDWTEFCDKLDFSLEEMQDDSKLMSKRLSSILWVSTLLAIICLAFIPDPEEQGRDWVGIIVSSSSALLCILSCIVSASYCHQRPEHKLSLKEATKKIRDDCEDMSNATPGVSFHYLTGPRTPEGPSSGLGRHIQVSFAMNVMPHLSDQASIMVPVIAQAEGHCVPFAEASVSTRDDGYAPVCKVQVDGIELV